MDNPFGTTSGDSETPDQTSPAGTDEKSTETSSEVSEEASAFINPPVETEPVPEYIPPVTEPSEAVLILQKVLEEHDGLESNIPLTHPEYWAAKRRL